MLEKDKLFLIHGFYYFLIYDSNTFEVFQEQKFKNKITYISIIDSKRFLIAFEHNYEYYQLKNNKYESTKNIKIEKDGKREDLNAITLLKDQTKIACGEGNIISIRELETGKLTLTLTKHKGSLQVLFVHKNDIHKNFYLVSCCSYLNLCFWNLNNYQLIKELKVDIKSPTSYLILKNTLDDLMITIGYSFFNKVDLDTLTIEGKISDSNIFSLITGSIQLNSIYVLIAAHDMITQNHNFYLLDIDDMEIQLMKKNIHNCFCDVLIKIGEKRFVSICRDLTFKVWEIKNKPQDQLDNLINSFKMIYIN